MNNRKFKPGTLVRKLPNAGFVGEELILRIPDPATFAQHDLGSLDENLEPCFICDNENCMEYANLEVVDEQGNVRGWIHHVSECQMKVRD